MKYVVSVAKTYKHRGKHRHNQAKKHWFVYYYDHDDLSIHVQVDIVAGDGSIIQTWDYRQCDIEGYWTYIDDWKEYYKYIPGNESEIHERFQFECRGFSLLVR